MDLSTLLALIPAQYMIYVTAAVGVFSILATLLPPPKIPASGFYPVVYGIVNLIAANLGHARNATAPVVAPVATPNNGASVR